jgi:hypothetical protein
MDTQTQCPLYAVTCTLCRELIGSLSSLLHKPLVHTSKDDHILTLYSTRVPFKIFTMAFLCSEFLPLLCENFSLFNVMVFSGSDGKGNCQMQYASHSLEYRIFLVREDSPVENCF